MEVIHDWDDERAAKILERVRSAARPQSKVLLIEAIIPNGTAPSWPKTLDILMLLIGGQQRTLQEYATLLEETGFTLTREIDTHTGVSIIEAVCA
jgi:O-methyltransferase domain